MLIGPKKLNFRETILTGSYSRIRENSFKEKKSQIIQ